MSRLIAWGKQIPILQEALGTKDVDGCLGLGACLRILGSH
jgi:hypothetical protein